MYRSIWSLRRLLFLHLESETPSRNVFVAFFQLFRHRLGTWKYWGLARYQMYCLEQLNGLVLLLNSY